MGNRKQFIFSFLCILGLIAVSCTTSIKHKKSAVEYHEKTDELLIILGGFVGGPEDVAQTVDYFEENSEYHVINVNYQSKKGFSVCTDNLKRCLDEMKLDRYKKVNFFCYIMGGMILREYLKRDSIPNLGRIVMDRGPLQERVALVTINNYPNFLIRKFWGKTIFDISAFDFSYFTDCDAEFGLLIETRASKVARSHIYQVLYGDSVSFDPDDIMSGYKDYTYIPMNHDEMYTGIAECGPLILNFLRTGSFGKNAERNFDGFIEGIHFYHHWTSCCIGFGSACLFFAP